MRELFTSKFDIKQEPALRSKLENQGFTFKQTDHAFWRVQNKGVTATLYRSGKIVVQGKETESFIQNFLGEPPQVVQTQLNIVNNDTRIIHSSWIGTDESGKGDYFGPLVVAGVLVEKENVSKFIDFGVKDSKKINDVTIEKIAEKIKENSLYSVIVMNPAKYNQLYSSFKNLNTLLAWGHARAIENILEKKECNHAISDKFGNESLIKNALMTKGKMINLEQRVRAEDDVAVAAASILARNEFVQRIKKMSLEYGIDFQKGASQKVVDQARLFAQKYGFDKLSNVAKLHFKTTLEVESSISLIK